MRPAFSVVFLTTLIGAGQGLIIALVAGQFYFAIGATPQQESGLFYAVGAALALALQGLGLSASFFHLANPRRAWRAATRWRTSWLSREVILLPAVMGLTLVYGTLHWLGWEPVLHTFGNRKSLDLPMAVGFLAVAAALALYFCTGMIYACVKFVREWASIWTVINYTLIGLASGFTMAAAYAGAAGSPLLGPLGGAALTLIVTALTTRAFHLWRNIRPKQRSTMKSAIGMHHSVIRQVSQGFNGRAFNTREFVSPAAPGTLKRLSAIFLVVGFGLPALLVAAGWATAEMPLLWIAAAVQYLGLVVERWVFFAAGRHVQSMYYQRMA